MGKYIFVVKYNRISINAESKKKATELAFDKIKSDMLDADFEVYCGNCEEDLDVCCCDNCCCEADDASEVESEQ